MTVLINNQSRTRRWHKRRTYTVHILYLIFFFCLYCLLHLWNKIYCQFRVELLLVGLFIRSLYLLSAVPMSPCLSVCLSECVFSMCILLYRAAGSWPDGIVLSPSSSFARAHRNPKHAHCSFIVLFPDCEWLTKHLFSPTDARRAAGGSKM